MDTPIEAATIDTVGESADWCESCGRSAAFTVRIDAAVDVDGLPSYARTVFVVCWDCLPTRIAWAAA